MDTWYDEPIRVSFLFLSLLLFVHHYVKKLLFVSLSVLPSDRKQIEARPPDESQREGVHLSIH